MGLEGVGLRAQPAPADPALAQPQPEAGDRWGLHQASWASRLGQSKHLGVGSRGELELQGALWPPGEWWH